MIRLATTADIPRLLELEQRLFDNALTESMLARELKVGEGFVFVDEEDNLSQVLGYALVRADGALRDITRLGVDSMARGSGIGTALLKHVISARGAIALSVRKNNPDAIRLYLKHGFKIVGHFTGATAWAMLREAGDGARRAAG